MFQTIIRAKYDFYILFFISEAALLAVWDNLCTTILVVIVVIWQAQKDAIFDLSDVSSQLVKI